MRVLFAGTPQTAVPALTALLASPHDVVAVLTRPDAAAGRGRRVGRSPVAEIAAEAGLELCQPTSLRDPTFLEWLRDVEPDCCAVVAYGALIPAAALAVPRHGWVNLHFSLLPAWRGAAPVQHAILHGDDITGATTFRLEEGLDTGPVFGVVTEGVRPRDTAGDLLGRLADSGAQLLLATLDGIESGHLVAQPQPADGVTLAPKLTVDDARIDWTAPALHVDRLVRACTPNPGPWTTLAGRRIKIGPISPQAVADPADPAGPDGALALPPGALQVHRDGVRVGTGSHPVTLGDVQPEGRRAMPATDWARGLRLTDREQFDS